MSTTSDIDVAVRFAAPFNPIVVIDARRFVTEFHGRVIDLSSKENFEQNIPPATSDQRDPEYGSKLLRLAKIVSRGEEGWTKGLTTLPDVSEKDALWMYEHASLTPWECARTFASRSKEVLFVGTVPSSCYQILNYDIVTTSVDYTPRHSLPHISDLNEFVAINGTNDFRMANYSETFAIKQAAPNLNPIFLDTAEMCTAIDLQFAAFSFYRLVEAYCPSMELHVQDCAKVSFNISTPDGGMKWSLKCLISENIDTLQPVRVGWKLFPEVSVVNIKKSLFGMSLNATERNLVTTEEIIERWRVTEASFSEEDAARTRSNLGPGKLHRVYRHLATEHAIPALKGVVADMFLANVYAWGVFDKPKLFQCSSTGKIYRTCVQSALGSSYVEYLNQDRSSTSGNLGFLTYLAAAGKLPCFYDRRIGDAPITGGPTYEKQTVEPLLSLIAEQIRLLNKLYLDHNAELCDVFQHLLLPPETYRVAKNFPKAAWYANIEPQVFWSTFVHGRLLHALMCLGMASDPGKAILNIWSSYNIGIYFSDEIFRKAGGTVD